MHLESMAISFEKAMLPHQQRVLSWLGKPHVQTFWDNSEAHRDDIDIFIKGGKIPRPYFNGIFDYWIGAKTNQPFWPIGSEGAI